MAIQLSPMETRAIEGMCLDNRPANLDPTLARIRLKLGTGRQTEVTIHALRESLVDVGKWKQKHPFQTKRELSEREQQLIKAYVNDPSLSRSARGALLSERHSSRVWRQIYEALGVESRTAALTASYLLGYWE